MKHKIYTASGCARCKITKHFMRERNIDFDEIDFKAEGQDAFAQFYRTNRKAIFRDKDGVEFPVFTDGIEIRQGVSVVIGYLIAKNQLEGFIGRSLLHGVWIDGFDISGGDPAQVENLIKVLSFLKSNGLKIQITTNGRNASVLEAILAKSCCDRVIMEVNGPAELYDQLTSQKIDGNELKQSIQLASSAHDYRFFTIVAPLERTENQIEYLTPEEIGETAKLIEESTGSKKHAYELRRFDPVKALDGRFKTVDPLASSAFFKYRTAARRYQVMTEIEK
jgi:glutaredoxin